MFIDTHAHIYWDSLLPRIEEILENAKKANVWKIICIWCNQEASLQAKELSDKYKEVFFTVWVHPSDAKLEVDWDVLEKLIEDPKCVWIWECGFDFYHDDSFIDIQEEVFQKQINLAEKYNKPLIIHTRNASEKTLEYLENIQSRFVIHCFTEWKAFAEKILNLWWLISIWGIITYPKAQELRGTIKYYPLDKIMLETDCPFLAPQSVRWTINEPANIPEIALKLSEIKGISLKEVEEVAMKNSEGFFGF